MSKLHPVVLLVLLVSSFFLPRAARADVDTCPPAPLVAPRASVVRVEALEHAVLGVVAGEPDLVVVPYEAIEVDRVDGPDATVVDRTGRRHRARVVATARDARISLLRTSGPLAEPVPIATAPAPCLYILPALLGTTTPEAVDWHRHRPHGDVPMDGSAVVDEQGALHGIVSSPPLGGERTVPLERIEALLARRGQTDDRAGRRSVIFYGGFPVMQFETARRGGGWWGGSGSIATRYRDLLQARLDLGLTFLVRRDTFEDACGSPPCFHGVRVAATPSLGLRLRLGSLGHAEHPIAFTPSIGWAFVAQEVFASAPAFDREAPKTFSTFAPGLSFSASLLEVGVRVRVPRGQVGDARAPTWEVGLTIVL